MDITGDDKDFLFEPGEWYFSSKFLDRFLRTCFLSQQPRTTRTVTRRNSPFIHSRISMIMHEFRNDFPENLVLRYLPFDASATAPPKRFVRKSDVGDVWEFCDPAKDKKSVDAPAGEIDGGRVEITTPFGQTVMEHIPPPIDPGCAKHEIDLSSPNSLDHPCLKSLPGVDWPEDLLPYARCLFGLFPASGGGVHAAAAGKHDSLGNLVGGAPKIDSQEKVRVGLRGNRRIR